MVGLLVPANDVSIANWTSLPDDVPAALKDEFLDYVEDAAQHAVVIGILMAKPLMNRKLKPKDECVTGFSQFLNYLCAAGWNILSFFRAKVELVLSVVFKSRIY